MQFMALVTEGVSMTSCLAFMRFGPCHARHSALSSTTTLSPLLGMSARAASVPSTGLLRYATTSAQGGMAYPSTRR
jgi:hypothetical protein